MPRQIKALELLKFNAEVKGGIVTNWNAPEFESIRLDMVKDFKDKQNEKLRRIRNSRAEVRERTRAESILNIEEFEKNSIATLSQLICMYVNEDMEVPSNWTVFRDYNLTTKVGLRTLEKIAKCFNTSLTEIDIVSCNIAIIYGICGVTLPENIYGENKKNKQSINVLINDFMYNENDHKARDKAEQRKAGKKKFRRYGIDERVIDWLYENYFESEFADARGLLSQTLAYHEKHIIDEAMELVATDFNEGVIRRHDSIIIYNNRESLSMFNEFVYSALPNVKGLFKIDAKENAIEEEMMREINRLDKIVPIDDNIVLEDIEVQTKISFDEERKNVS